FDDFDELRADEIGESHCRPLLAGAYSVTSGSSCTRPSLRLSKHRAAVSDTAVMETSVFKSARHTAGMSVDDVVRATRLSPRLVAAIDAGRYDLLPAGIYARTAVRAYAAAVGLDATAVVAEVRPLLPDARLDMLEVAELRAAREDRHPGLRYFLAAAVDGAVVLLIAGAIATVCGAVCQLMPT